jgi:carboxypeptidase D
MCAGLTASAAYYNAGSAAIVLVLVLLAIGVFVWCRIRRRRRARGGAMQLPPRPGPDDEESIPLRATDDYARANGRDHESGGENRYAAEDEGVPRYDTRAGSMREGKGKARAQEAIFDVGESDEEK